MTAQELQTLVNEQIRGERDVEALRALLVEPHLVECVDPTTKGKAHLWLVAQADYGIAFDERAGEFGLLEFRSDMPPVLIGIYGSFVDALDAQ